MTDLIKKIVCESDLFYPIFVQNGAAKRGDIGYDWSTEMTREAGYIECDALLNYRIGPQIGAT